MRSNENILLVWNKMAAEISHDHVNVTTRRACTKPTPLEIPKLVSIDPADFKRDYLESCKPVILSGYTRSWQASKWTLQDLKNRVGQNLINVRRKTNLEEYKVGQKYDIEKMKFEDYVDNIMKDNKKSKGSYMAVQNIKQAFPQLQDELPIPELVGKMHAGPFLWIAKEGHYEFCHFDPDDNILIILRGRKKVKLFGCDLKPMYPNELGSKGRTIQSQVYCDDPDLERFPEFEKKSCYECILEAGDLLYFPAFWWHQVTSLETTISVNMFFGDSGENTYLTKIMNSNQFPAFQHWLLNIIEQNRTTAQFQKVLENLPKSVEGFLLKQWHEIPSKEQLDVLLKLIMEYLGIERIPECKETKNPPPLKIRGLLWRS